MTKSMINDNNTYVYYTCPYTPCVRNIIENKKEAQEGFLELSQI